MPETVLHRPSRDQPILPLYSSQLPLTILVFLAKYAKKVPSEDSSALGYRRQIPARRASYQLLEEPIQARVSEFDKHNAGCPALTSLFIWPKMITSADSWSRGRQGTCPSLPNRRRSKGNRLGETRAALMRRCVVCPPRGALPAETRYVDGVSDNLTSARLVIQTP